MQLHDFNGGIQPSGLFWIVQVPDDALKMEGLTAKLHVENASVIDDFQFFAPGGVPATVSFDITWFRLATATGSFSGSESGFSFTGQGSSTGVFAEMGTELNGFFLNGHN